MKLLVISDIHGSLFYLKKILNIFEKNNYDKILILGDELYHGPRNPLPKEYNPKEAAELLNRYKNKIIAVRGNCDSEVDQMVLDFPITADYNMILWENKKIFMTHGHIYNIDNSLPLENGDILIYGHFHIPMIQRKEGKIFLNPGSISLPKGESLNSFGVFENGKFYIKDMEENILMETKL